MVSWAQPSQTSFDQHAKAQCERLRVAILRPWVESGLVKSLGSYTAARNFQACKPSPVLTERVQFHARLPAMVWAFKKHLSFDLTKRRPLSSLGIIFLG